MWHSKLPTGERGIIVDFKKPVELEEFEILTRRDCCNHRYEFVCLYVDDLKVKFFFNRHKTGKKVRYKTELAILASSVD